MKKFNEFLFESEEESGNPPELTTDSFETPPSKEVESFYSDWGFGEVLSGIGTLSVLNSVRKGYKYNKMLSQGVAELSKSQVTKSPGFVSKMAKGLWNILRGGNTATKTGQLAMNFAKSPSVWARLGGIFLTSTGGTGALTGTVGFLGLTPVGWITLGVIAISGIFIYTFWNDDMYEIDEIWKSKKHNKGKQDAFTKQIYDLITKGLFESRILGTGIIEEFAKITKNKKFSDGEKLVIRLSNDALIKEGYRYDEGVGQLDKIFKSSEMQKTIIGTSTTSADWIDDVKNNYDGFPISGKENLDDYGTIKKFVTKWMFENSSNDKNYYGKSLAEDSEGWFDTKFDTATPGLNTLGYATYFLSEDYLNNINSLGLLKNKRLLWMVMQSYWITKISNLDASTFSINQFCKLVGVLSGGVSNPYTDPNFVSQLQYWKYSEKGGINGVGSNERLGSFQEILTAVGVYITEQSRNIAKTDAPSVVSNLTVSFALLWATYSLLYQIQVGSLITFGQLSYLVWLNKEENEIAKLDITKAKSGSVGGEDRGSYMPTSTTNKDVAPTPKAPVNIEEFIEKVDSIAGFDKFEG